MSNNATIFCGDDYDLGNNVQIDELESERQTVVAFYVDKSGSMCDYDGIMPDCIQCFKDSVINSKSEDEFLISYTQFDHNINRSGYKMVSDVDTSYHAGGGTALYDAIVAAQESLVTPEKDGYIDTLKKNNITTKGIFVIFTDGYDEHSKLGVSAAKKAIDFLNQKEIITVFIGFGSNACGIGKDLGFKNVLDEKETNEKTLRNIFDIVSKSIVSASKNAINPSAGTFFQV